MPEIPTNNTELYLANIAGESDHLPDFPTNNIERYLAYIAGVADVMPLFPTNKIERYLSLIALYKSATEKTKTGAVVHITDGLPKAARSLTVSIMPVQSGSGDPSPTNIRPISGRTGANVYHSGADTSDATTYAFDFPDAAGTVYGGTLDVTNGKLTVDREMVDMTAITDWNIDRNAQRIYKTRSDMKPNTSGATVPNLLSNRFEAITPNAIYANTQGVSLSVGSALQFHIDGLTDNADVTLEEVNQWFIDNPTQVAYELATPAEYTLTPTEVTMLLGENNIWADAGDVTVTYLAGG